MANFRPVVALAGRLTRQRAGRFSPRHGLVVMQFAISQTLIIGLIVVAKQLHYVQTKDLGFRKDVILAVDLPNVPSQDVGKMRAFRNLANALPDVLHVSYSMGGPPQSGWMSQTSIRFDNCPEEEQFSPQQAWIDAEYVGLYGLKLIAGRNLQPSDTARETLINETLMQRLAFTRPADVVGKHLHKASFAPLEIVGVLKDYNQSDLRQRISPIFLTTVATGYYSANIQLRSADYGRALKQLEKAYNQVYADSFCEPKFVDDQIRENYNHELTIGRLINFFASIALLIGCMGLYGLILFMVVQRTEEVGVRKVLGAGVGSNLWLFNRELLQLVGITFFLSAPVALWVMKGWLSNFEYRIFLGPAIFLPALPATLVIALITVSFQIVKAAVTNPVKSLRSE